MQEEEQGSIVLIMQVTRLLREKKFYSPFAWIKVVDFPFCSATLFFLFNEKNESICRNVRANPFYHSIL